MKVVIISDIHDNLVNLGKCLHWCRKSNLGELICCGDLTNSETLEFLAQNFKGIIYLVRGNIEIYDEDEVKQYKNIKYYGKIGKVELDEKAVGFGHEPYFIDDILEKEKYDIIFYGHTHRPWEFKKKGAKIVNPGTLGGVFNKATFAVWESASGKLELKILENL